MISLLQGYTIIQIEKQIHKIFLKIIDKVLKRKNCLLIAQKCLCANQIIRSCLFTYNNEAIKIWAFLEEAIRCYKCYVIYIVVAVYWNDGSSDRYILSFFIVSINLWILTRRSPDSTQRN